MQDSTLAPGPDVNYIHYGLTMNLKEAKALFIKAQHQYYHDPNGRTLLSDAEFDKLEAKIAEVDPDWPPLHKTGGKKLDAALPFFMPSLAKTYDKDWVPPTSLVPHLISAKIDGSALLLVYRNHKPYRLYTRGDGVTGGDISFILPHLAIPKRIEASSAAYRCEATIPLDVFRKQFANRFANPRAAVNGQLNRTAAELVPAILKTMHIVVVGVYGTTIAAGLRDARAEGFNVVQYKIVSRGSLMTTDYMLGLKEKWADNPYETDGLVYSTVKAGLIFEHGNPPKHFRAFKANAKPVMSKVRDIIWQASGYGRWTPKVLIDPVVLNGTTVRHATLHNTKWMLDRKIGVGSIIEIVKGGEVIPKVVGVIKPGRTVMPPGKTYWKGVHLYKEETDTADVLALQMLRELRGYGIEEIATSSLLKAIEAGNTTFLDLYKLPVGELMNIFGKAKGAKFHVQRQRLHITPAQWIAFSPAYGEGVALRKAQILLEETTLNYLVKGDIDVLRIKHVGPSLKQILKDRQKEARQLLRQYVQAGIHFVKPEKVKLQSNQLEGNNFAFTGYRDKEQEAMIVSNGGTIVSSTSKTLNVLFFNPDGKFLAKVDKARAAGVQCVPRNEFQSFVLI